MNQSLKARIKPVSLFESLCVAAGFERPEKEYRFHPVRKWRFDWCFVAAKLAIEIQGGLFARGRHTQGAALLREYEKLNAACCLGYRILFITPEQMASGDVFAILEVLEKVIGKVKS